MEVLIYELTKTRSKILVSWLVKLLIWTKSRLKILSKQYVSWDSVMLVGIRPQLDYFPDQMMLGRLNSPRTHKWLAADLLWTKSMMLYRDPYVEEPFMQIHNWCKMASALQRFTWNARNLRCTAISTPPPSEQPVFTASLSLRKTLNSFESRNSWSLNC